MKSVRRSAIVAGAIALVIVGRPPAAHAAGFASAKFGGEQGTVVSTNPTALYYNPAGIAFSEGIHLYLDGELAMRHATWDHPADPPNPMLQPNAGLGNSGEASLFNVFGGPALAATMKIQNLAIGVGLFVPFGGRVTWGQNSAFANVSTSGLANCADKNNPQCPLAVDGPQRWHIITGALTFIYATAGAAYKLGPVSIGASGNFINSSITETQARTLTGGIDSTVENRATLDVGGNNGSFAVGAMLEAVPNRLWVGGSYQAQPGLGPQTLKGTLNYVSGAAPNYSATGTTHYDVDFHQSLPDIYRAGVRLRVTDAVELRLFGDYTRWSVMQSQCVNIQGPGFGCGIFITKNPMTNGTDSTTGPQNGMGSTLADIQRNWKNTYSGHVGGSYWLKPEIELFAGAGYETGAAPDSTMEPGAMDSDNISIALGGRFLLGHSFYLAGSYTHLQFFDRNVTTSELSSINGVPLNPPGQTQNGNGQYTQWIGIFDVNMEKQF